MADKIFAGGVQIVFTNFLIIKERPVLERFFIVNNFFVNKFDDFLKGDRKVCDLVIANLIAIATIFLSSLLPFANYILPILLLFYFKVGVFGFVLHKETDELFSYERIFVSIKKILTIFCVSIAKILIILFGFCIFFVPGVVFYLDYCFSPIIIFESKNMDSKGVLMLSKELVRGFRLEIFTNILLACFAEVLLASLSFLIMFIFDIFLCVPLSYYLIFGSLVISISTFLFAIPFVETTIVQCFLKAKQQIVTRK